MADHDSARMRAPLLERESELALLHRRQRAAGGADGRVVVVEGRAGMGKSSLLAAARVRAEDAGFLASRPGAATSRARMRSASSASSSRPGSPRRRRGSKGRRPQHSRPSAPARRWPARARSTTSRWPSFTGSTGSPSTPAAIVRSRSSSMTRSGPTCRACGSWPTSRPGSSGCACSSSSGSAPATGWPRRSW